MLAPILSPDLSVPHGFFTRNGGVSTGLYGSLNCGLGSMDDLSHVTENRNRVVEAMGAMLHTAQQIHSTMVAIALANSDPAIRPQADALVTRDTGVALGILTADCAPILFHDPVAGVIGAAHAGWKGALNNIMERTIKTMETLGASRTNITAAIGPCIGQQSYEVGPEFLSNFIAESRENARYFIGGQGDRMLFDLPSFVLDRLRKTGIANADFTGHCTFSEPSRFFSYRRCTHAGEPDYGRQISCITL